MTAKFHSDSSQTFLQVSFLRAWEILQFHFHWFISPFSITQGGWLLTISTPFQLCLIVTLNHGYCTLSCGFNVLKMAALWMKIEPCLCRVQLHFPTVAKTRITYGVQMLETHPRPSDSEAPGMEPGCVCLFVLTFFFFFLKSFLGVPTPPPLPLGTTDIFFCFSW